MPFFILTMYGNIGMMVTTNNLFSYEELSMFTIQQDQLPKIIKDLPWFIANNPDFYIEDIDGLCSIKRSLLSFMEMAKSEPEAIQFLEWLCENRNVVGIEATRQDTFTVYIKKKKLPNGMSSETEFLSNTLPSELKDAFIKHGIIKS